jgi:hypothetical protein
MKTTVNIAIALCLLLFAFSSCKKADYLTDEGLHTTKSDLSTYDYLAHHPAGMFDTLLLVIDHFGLKEEINNAGTFFAPSDYSIKRFYNARLMELRLIDENATYSLEQMYADIDVDSLRTYIYNGGKYGLNAATAQYQAIRNASDLDGFAFHKQKQPQGTWTFQPIYYLYYVKVRGLDDGVNEDGVVTTAPDDPSDIRVLCQTTGIETASGTLINVLANTHIFISDFNPPAERVERGDRTFTYNLSFPLDETNYSGTSVTVDSAQLAASFGLTSAQLRELLGSSITFYGVESNGSLNPNNTANAPGHWFDAAGNIGNWGADARLFSEYNTSSFTFSIGQFPGQCAVGDTFTIKQALVYVDEDDLSTQATFVFNVKIE